MKKISISILGITLVLIISYGVVNFLLPKEEIRVAQKNNDSNVEYKFAKELSEEFTIDMPQDSDSMENGNLESEPGEMNGETNEEPEQTTIQEIKEESPTQQKSNSQATIKNTENKPVEVKQEIVTETQITTLEPAPVVIATQIQPIQETKEPEVTEEKIEMVTGSSQDTNIETKEEGEKYVRNDAMINTIREVINNNESEYMKSYGYTVEVDASIKEHTNQFTFTENRVKAFITYKFGTIRIYAEDYYRNGQFIMTECYIF